VDGQPERLRDCLRFALGAAMSIWLRQLVIYLRPLHPQWSSGGYLTGVLALLRCGVYE
jgi:hypothetical protein